MNGRHVGATQSFVLGRSFVEVEGYTALLAGDGSLRLLGELSADPDRPEVRPQDAYRELLASLSPGWTLRLLQVTWPAPGPRRAFLAGVRAWEGGAQGGLEALRQAMAVFLEAFPLPYHRRTLLEVVLPAGAPGAGWWAGAEALLGRYGLALTPLGEAEILSLARLLLNPELE